MKNLHWDQPFIQYGVGAFETLRCRAGEFPLAIAHQRRLLKALEHWKLEPRLLDEAWDELLQKGRESRSDQRFKLLLGLGENGELIHHIYQFDYQALPEKRRLCLAQQVMHRAQPYKSSSYEAHYWARQEALRAGFDDVLYIDALGCPLECSTSAILEFREGFFFAPQGPVLASVSVAHLLEHYPAVFKRLPSLEPGLWQQRKWVTCNALHGLRAVESIQVNSLETNCPMVEADVLQFWNQQLFSSTAN